MNTFARWSMLAGLLLGSTSAHAGTAAQPVGRWEGAIQAPQGKFQIAVDLARNAKGELTGAFSNAEHHILGFPLSDVVVDGRTIRFRLNATGGGAFQCQLARDRKSMSGAFTTATARGDTSLPFTLTRTGDARIQAPPPSPAIGKELVGAWNGTMEVEGHSMRIALELENRPDGSSAGTMANLDRGGLGIPVTAITQTDSSLVVEVKTIGGSYSAVLRAGTELVGTWTQGSIAFPLTLRRTPAASAGQ